MINQGATTLAAPDERQALAAALAGRYALERELGRGGMGVVYLARDLALERPVAIKLLPAALAAQPELRDRFLRETRTAAGLAHPNIVPIHAVEERDGLVFYVMGFIDGETLAERVRRAGPLPPDEVARVLQEAAWALSYAHSRGIVHRDVKPDNILVERGTGRAFLTDFGIARLADSTMTAVGTSLGTPQFMSPEQATGDVVDARSDLYSLGIVGFFALTGRLPFEAPTFQAILAMQVTKPAPPVASARPDVPRRLADAIDRCLLKDPDARWPSAEAFANALRATQGAAVEVAPPVRNFLRMAEMTTLQVVTFLTAVPVMQAGHADMRVVLLWLGIVIVVVLMQVGARARLLLRQGFTYDDVRAGFAAELRHRQEEQEAVGAGLGAARNARSWPVIAGMMLGGGFLGAGIGVASKSHLHTTRGLIALALIAAGIVTMMLTLALGSKRFLRMERNTTRLAARIWTGWFGRMFFRLASRGAVRGGDVMIQDPTARTAVALFAELPPALRKRLDDVRTLLPRLEAEVRALEAREQQLDRALTEAGAASGVTPVTPVTASGAAHTGDDTGARPDRRAALVDELRAARDEAAARRAAALEVLDTLRLHLLRLRSGLGDPADLAPDVEAGRGLLR